MTQRISGIGGIFFRAKDATTLGSWYEQHFGINSTQADSVWMQEAGPTVFAPFKEDTNYFGSLEQQFMLNFRVHDLDLMIDQLRAAGVRIDDKRMDESYGRFAWVYDPEGNKIELWQPLPAS